MDYNKFQDNKVCSCICFLETCPEGGGVVYCPEVLHGNNSVCLIIRHMGVCLFMCAYVPNVYNYDCRVVGVVRGAGQRPLRPHHHRRVS